MEPRADGKGRWLEAATAPCTTRATANRNAHRGRSGVCWVVNSGLLVNLAIALLAALVGALLALRVRQSAGLYRRRRRDRSVYAGARSRRSRGRSTRRRRLVFLLFAIGAQLRFGTC